VLEQLRRQLPQRTELALGLAATLNNVGILYRREGRSDEALQALKQAIEIKEKLVHDYPASRSFQSSLAKSYSGMGTLQSAMGNQQLSLEALRKALEIDERLVQAHPGIVEFQASLSKTFNNLAVTYRKDKQIEQAIAHQQKSIDMNRRIASQHPSSAEFQSELAKGLLNLAAMQRDQKAFADSARSYQSASETVGGFVKTAARYKVVEVFLRDAQWARGVREARDLVGMSAEHAGTLYQQAVVHARIVATALNDASLAKPARDQIVRDETAQVISLLSQAKQAAYFQQAERAQALRDDQEFAPLKNQAAFEDFLRELR
jgi:tetratricopeptide (TPR) repeat protein